MAKTEPSILPLEGEIDLHVSPQIGASLATLIAKKPPQLVVDLSKVSYIDSSGLAVLIEAMQNVGSLRRKIRPQRLAGERASDFRNCPARSGLPDFSRTRRPLWAT